MGGKGDYVEVLVMNESKKELAYYLTLFKIEGHTTFRAFLGNHRDNFEKQKGDTFPPITEIQTFRVDRKTGTLEIVK